MWLFYSNFLKTSFILFFFFCLTSCARKDILVTCKDLPKEELTTTVQFNEPISCIADSPFTDESLNKFYGSFFQRSFSIYEVKNLKSTTTTSKTIHHSENLIETRYLQSKASKPLYYIRAFSPYYVKVPPDSMKNLIETRERAFHILYYETVDEHSSEEVDEPNNFIALDYELVNENVVFDWKRFWKRFWIRM